MIMMKKPGRSHMDEVSFRFSEPKILRRVISRSAAAFAVAVIGQGLLKVFPAYAAKKSTKKQVLYQETPKGERQCAGCAFFLPDEKTCKVVEGEIVDTGWCARWAKKKA